MQVLTVDCESENAPETFAKSLHETGFAVLKNHPINNDIINSIYEQWLAFYRAEDKHQYLYDKKNFDGYYPFRCENAAGYSVKNLMEYFHLFTWGQRPEKESEIALKYHEIACDFAIQLLHWAHDHLPEDIKQSLSIPLYEMSSESPRNVLRIIHYPPLDGAEEKGAFRAYDHEDINLITVLPAATSAGLQVKDAQDQWYDVPCDPGTIIINTGDMMQMCTQGYYKSTTHRVNNPQGELAKQPRMSIPLFVHPRDDVRLSPEFTAYEFMIKRFKNNGLIK